MFESNLRNIVSKKSIVWELLSYLLLRLRLDSVFAAQDEAVGVRRVSLRISSLARVPAQDPLSVVGRQPHLRISDGSFSVVSTTIFAST